MHSIRTKITAITIAAILTTILAVFVACYSTIQVENDRRSVEIMDAISHETTGSMQVYLDSIEQSVETAANLAVDTLDSFILIESAAIGSDSGTKQSSEQSAVLDEYLSGYCDRLQMAYDSIARRTQGIVSYYFTVTPEISSSVHGFYYTNAGKTGYSRLDPIDASTLDPKDNIHDSWYFLTVQRGRPSWIGPIQAGENQDTWVYTYAVPVYSAGSLIGVIGMDIPVSTLVSQVSSIKVLDSGYATLIDSEGNVIYHPQMECGSRLSDSGFESVSSILDNESNNSDLIRYTYNGVKKQLSFSSLSNGMKLIISAPTSEINASWNRLLHMIYIITAFVIVFFAALVMFVMRLITNPLVSLTAASQKLADGDYDIELDYDKEDEIGVLTRAFMRMRDQIRAYIEDLNHRINTDALTDLPNMRCFFRLAKAEKERLIAEGSSPVLLYFDILGMRHYNHQFGFDEGDKLICSIGEIIAKHFGRECMCRYGDDHFSAISSEDGIESKIDAVLEDCRGANNRNSLPVSVGIYSFSLGDVSVSIACDRAKFACDTHRGAYVSGCYRFDSDMLRQVNNTRHIINNLDRALEERWIQIYYQPIIRTSSGKVCDEEALSRWIDPELGFLSPADFIPILESSGLIYRLDLYVLDRILEKMHAQTEAGFPLVPVSLNLSRSDFDSCDIVEEIQKRVDAAGISRDMLTIEITESIVGSDFDFIKSQILRFQALGFPVWMDDFGSGYSSLDVLQDIHFDLLKFDMLFMQRFSDGNESRIILRELMQMAEKLNIETVCEGVETAEQADFLREIGCTKMQGYYFGKPVSYEMLLEKFAQGTAIEYEDE